MMPPLSIPTLKPKQDISSLSLYQRKNDEDIAASLVPLLNHVVVLQGILPQSFCSLCRV